MVLAQRTAALPLTPSSPELLWVGLGHCRLLDHCNPHRGSLRKESPVPGFHKGKTKAKEVNTDSGRECKPLSLWALQSNFTASAHLWPLFLPHASTFSLCFE